MKSDWFDATDSLAQQITDQQKEIKEQKNRYENLKKENACLKVTINNMVKRDEEKKDLQEEFDDYVFRHPCDMVCRHCNITTTEDDLGISLDCGELTCESCFEEGKSKSLKD